MANLSVQNILKTGITPSFVAAAGGGDEFPNNGKTIFHVKNGGGSPITVTLVTQATTDELAVADRQVTVPAGGEKQIADLDPDVYNVPSTGRVQVTYSGVTSVTVGVFRPNGV